MNKILRLFALLFLAIPLYAQGVVGGHAVLGGSTFTFPHTASCQTAGISNTCTTGSITVTAGHALVAYAGTCTSSSGGTCNDQGKITSIIVTDSNGGNTWECPAGSFYTGGGNDSFTGQSCYACNAVGATYTFTMTITATGGGHGDFPSLGVVEVAGASTSSGTGCADTALINSAGANTSGNPSIVAATSIVQANEAVFGMGFFGAGITSNQTEILNLAIGIGIEWTQPASGTPTMSWTMSNNTWVGAVIGIKHP